MLSQPKGSDQDGADRKIDTNSSDIVLKDFIDMTFPIDIRVYAHTYRKLSKHIHLHAEIGEMRNHKI